MLKLDWFLFSMYLLFYFILTRCLDLEMGSEHKKACSARSWRSLLTCCAMMKKLHFICK